ncbi:MAG TPA: zinc-ribbon domain-containing protein [Casimicrobiaceae bacterium]|nr:zinc-ribbon domain-containing protein [Casimicrobiaceae bacterium]
MSRTADGGERRTTCPSCGRQVAAGARYCIQCGAEQSVPTPIAAVAAAMARGQPREAANAAHADPARSILSDASPTDAAPAAATLTRAASVSAANSAAPTPPAYDAGPPRARLAAVLIGCLVAVTIALAAVALWRGERGAAITAGESDAGATAASAAPSGASPRASTEAPPAPTVQTKSETASSPASAAGTNPAPGAPAPSTATPDVASGPVEIKALPPHAPARRSPHRSAPESTASAPPTPPPAEPAAAPAPPPIAQARSAAPARATQRVADHWQHLDDELSRCTREDFITRVICGQRARFRYCDGYWGKVPQCPGNPLPERGQ